MNNRLRQLIKEFYGEVENEEDNKNSKKDLANTKRAKGEPHKRLNNKMVGKN